MGEFGIDFSGLSFFVLPFSGQSDPTRSCEQAWAVVREAPILEDDHRPDITGTPIMLHGELKTPGMGEASMICGLRDRTSPDELLVT